MAISMIVLVSITILAFLSPISEYNVVNFGAREDGRTDSTAAFLRAWMAACSSASPSMVYVPRGSFVIRSAAFNGPCRSRIEFRIDGSLDAPDNYYALGILGSVDRIARLEQGDGYVRNLLFKNHFMRNVANPIIIDQKHCPDNSCPHQSSGVRVTDVIYRNIKGSSAIQAAVKFDCSASNPCRGITLQDIKLTYLNRFYRPTVAYCSVQGEPIEAQSVQRVAFE